MIDLESQRAWIKAQLPWVYVIWATGIAGFALAMVILDFFNIRNLELSTEGIAGLGVALVGPLLPFARSIKLPFGPFSIELAAARSAMTRSGLTLAETLPSSADAIAAADFTQIASIESFLVEPEDKSDV